MHCLGQLVHSKTELRIESARNQLGQEEDWLHSRTTALNQNGNVAVVVLPYTPTSKSMVNTSAGIH